MNQKTISYIYILFFLLFFEGVFSQSLRLKIISKDSIENIFLSKIVFQKKHLKETSIYLEIDTISTQLKQFGFFTNSIDTVIKKDTLYIARFILGKKTEKAIIKIYKGLKIQDSRFKIQDNKITISIQQLPTFLASISHQLEQEGKSFSEVKLKNIQLKKNILFANLNIHLSKERTVDKILVKGYEHFPKSYLKYFLNIKKRVIFNQKKIKNISASINSLNFVSEIKPLEVLFSKDSTLLYLYLKKEARNSFEGLISFASKKKGKGLLFNGYVDLKLTNLLDYGESFSLYWNSLGKEKQELKLTSNIPYVFGSAFSIKNSFTLYKQDSTFISSYFTGDISYLINRKIELSITLKKEESNNLLQYTNNIQSFKNSFYGIQFLYKKPKNDVFNSNTFFISINPSFGNRTTSKQKTSQFKINFESSFLWSINNRNSIYIRNKTGFLNSNFYLENELYRIGGIHSIRGFNEQSIFTHQYSFFNTEYRYSTSQNSYIYTITDFGLFKYTTQHNFLSIGLGYLFRLNNTQINIGYALGKTSNNFNKLDNSKILIQILNYF